MFVKFSKKKKTEKLLDKIFMHLFTNAIEITKIINS